MKKQIQGTLFTLNLFFYVVSTTKDTLEQHLNTQ